MSLVNIHSLHFMKQISLKHDGWLHFEHKSSGYIMPETV